MSTNESQISQLSEEIRASLKSKPDKLQEYDNILDNFSKNSANSSESLYSLLSLFQGNSYMIHKVNEAIKIFSPESAAVFPYFDMQRYIFEFFTKTAKIQDAKYKDEVMKFITTVIFLIIQEFLPPTYLSIKMKKIPHLPQQFIQTINEYMHQIAPVMKLVRATICDMYRQDDNLASQTYFIKAKIKPTPPMQFMVLAHLQLKSLVRMTSFVHCLSLFGLGLISEETTHKWLMAIDPIIADLFNCCPDTNFPFKFHPAKIYKQIMEAGLTESQINWLFGSQLVNFMRSIPSMNGENIFESAANADDKAFTKRHLIDIEPFIPEMKSITFYKSMLKIIKTLRLGTPLEGVEESLKAIYGELAPSIEATAQSPQFMLKFYERLKFFGGFAHQEFESLVKKKILVLDLGSKDWRIEYWPISRKGFFLRSIVFNGYMHELLPKRLEISVFHFLNKFVGNFQTIGEKYVFFCEALKYNHFFCLKGTALAIIYFYEVSRYLAEISSLTKKDLEELSDLLFENEPPISKYIGKLISHIDIPSFNFVQSLHKIQESEMSMASDVSELIGQVTDDFFFEVNITKNAITIGASINFSCATPQNVS